MKEPLVESITEFFIWCIFIFIYIWICLDDYDAEHINEEGF